MSPAAEGIAPTPDARRVMAARARETIADMLRTYEHIMNATPEDSTEWLKNQIETVAKLRTRQKGGRKHEDVASEDGRGR